MKFKVIAIIDDGVIAANKNNIVCFHDNSLRDNNGEDSLYHIFINQILSEKNHATADRYWAYTKKEWGKLNKEFSLIQLEK